MYNQAIFKAMNWPSTLFPVYFDTTGTCKSSSPDNYLALNSILTLSSTDRAFNFYRQFRLSTAFPAACA